MESGWWLTYPSEKYEFEWKVIKFMFQTTNQMGLSENGLYPPNGTFKRKNDGRPMVNTGLSENGVPLNWMLNDHVSNFAWL